MRLSIIGLGAASPSLLLVTSITITTTSFRGQWACRACPRPDARNFKVALRSHIHLWGNKKNYETETIVVSFVNVAFFVVVVDRRFPSNFIEDHI